MKDYLLKVVVFILTLFIIINNFIFFPSNILSWDVFGYYLYLPLKFVYNNLGLNNDTIINSIIEKYNSTGTFYQALKMSDGNYVMKYSMGMAFLYAPFFFIGHLIAVIFDYPVDGFSLPYQYSIFIGGIIYSIIGIWALSKVLIRFFSINVTIAALILTVFSTNYMVHITMYGQNAMSHNYLFTLYTLIIWLSILWHESFHFKFILMLGIVCGITILSRPSEIVCLIIPMLWGIKDKESFSNKVKAVLAHKKQVLLFTAILISFGCCQFIYWKIYTGNFIFDSYEGNAGEGFEFLSPYIIQVLFSFRKGWLVYTPLMIFSIVGFYFLFKKNKAIFYALFIYFIVNLYIISSWSCWWYAQSFSQRALIPSYPIMAIVLGYFLTWLSQVKSHIKIMLYMLLLCVMTLNLFQSKQFDSGVINGDKMTKEYYLRVFGKMQATKEDKQLLLIDRSFDGSEIFKDEEEYDMKTFSILNFENEQTKDSTVAYSGKYSYKLDSKTEFSPAIEVPYFDITSSDHAWIKVTVNVYPVENINSNPFYVVAHFNHKDRPYNYKTMDAEKMKLELNKWNKITFYYLTPEVRSKEDKLKTYIWYRGKSNLFIDDLKVDFYTKKDALL